MNRQETTEKLERPQKKPLEYILLITILILVGIVLFILYRNYFSKSTGIGKADYLKTIESYGNLPNNAKTLFGNYSCESSWFVQDEDTTAFILPDEFNAYESWLTDSLNVHVINGGKENLVEIPKVGTEPIIPLNLYLYDQDLYLTYANDTNHNKIDFIGILKMSDTGVAFNQIFHKTIEDLGASEIFNIDIKIVPPVFNNGKFYFPFDRYSFVSTYGQTYEVTNYTALYEVDLNGSNKELFSQIWDKDGSGQNSLFGPISLHDTFCLIPDGDHIYLTANFFLADFNIVEENITVLLNNSAYGESSPISSPKSVLLQDGLFYFENYGSLNSINQEGKDIETIFEMWPKSEDETFGGYGTPYLIAGNTVYYASNYGGEIKSYNLEDKTSMDFFDIESSYTNQSQKIFSISAGIDSLYVMVVYGEIDELESGDWKNSELIKIGYSGKSSEIISSGGQSSGSTTETNLEDTSTADSKSNATASSYNTVFIQRLCDPSRWTISEYTPSTESHYKFEFNQDGTGHLSTSTSNSYAPFVNIDFLYKTENISSDGLSGTVVITLLSETYSDDKAGNSYSLAEDEEMIINITFNSENSDTASFTIDSTTYEATAKYD